MDITQIDTENKPDWFLALSPLGKVPTLVINEQYVLFESLVIMNYLEETYTPSLLPEAPEKKAWLQAWMCYADTLMAKFGVIRKAQTPDELKAAIVDFQLSFDVVLAQYRKDKGEYFIGEQFSLLDATYAPLFVWCQHFSQFFETTILPPSPLLAKWSEVLLQRASVQKTIEANYADLLRAYFEKTNPVINAVVEAYRH